MWIIESLQLKNISSLSTTTAKLTQTTIHSIIPATSKTSVSELYLKLQGLKISNVSSCDFCQERTYSTRNISDEIEHAHVPSLQRSTISTLYFSLFKYKLVALHNIFELGGFSLLVVEKTAPMDAFSIITPRNMPPTKLQNNSCTLAVTTCIVSHLRVDCAAMLVSERDMPLIWVVEALPSSVMWIENEAANSLVLEIPQLATGAKRPLSIWL